jgi:RNA polymerase sigma factor (sigma-70 family)
MSENSTTLLDAWLTRIRDEDDTAYEELIRYFEKRLNELASRMLKGYPEVVIKEETGDVFQEMSLRLHSSLKALIASGKKPVGSKSFHADDFMRFAAYRIRLELLTLAKRHSRRRTVELPSHEGLGDPDTSTCNPASLAEWTEFHEQVANLPEKDREVFELSYYGGLKRVDIVQQLGVDVKTVRKYLRNAQRRLFEVLGGRLPGM